jgi:hypothetical protein
MSQAYSNPDRESDPHALPDLELFELTAREIAEGDDNLLYEYIKRHEFRLAGMNRRVRDRMIDVMIEEQHITGGWFYWYCFPGCMPDSEPMGPYPTRDEALKAAREDAAG